MILIISFYTAHLWNRQKILSKTWILYLGSFDIKTFQYIVNNVFKLFSNNFLFTFHNIFIFWNIRLVGYVAYLLTNVSRFRHPYWHVDKILRSTCSFWKCNHIHLPSQPTNKVYQNCATKERSPTTFKKVYHSRYLLPLKHSTKDNRNRNHLVWLIFD